MIRFEDFRKALEGKRVEWVTAHVKTGNICACMALHMDDGTVVHVPLPVLDDGKHEMPRGKPRD